MKVDAKGHEEEDLRLLRGFAAFEKFSDGELQRLVATAHRIARSKPWPLIQEQTPSDSCYILLSGEAGVYVGQDRVALLGPGEVIGESALRRGKLRSATVTTTGPSEVLRIERDDLARLLDEIPALRETMDATVAQHVPVEAPGRAAKPKPTHRRVDAQVPTELVERFEQAAEGAGVRVSAALEDALTGWLERNGGS